VFTVSRKGIARGAAIRSRTLRAASGGGLKRPFLTAPLSVHPQACRDEGRPAQFRHTLRGVEQRTGCVLQELRQQAQVAAELTGLNG